MLTFALWLEDSDHVTISVENIKGIAMHYGILSIPRLAADIISRIPAARRGLFTK